MDLKCAPKNPGPWIGDTYHDGGEPQKIPIEIRLKSKSRPGFPCDPVTIFLLEHLRIKKKSVKKIIEKLDYDEKYIMLDHDDLFSALTKLNESPDKFKDYINELVEFCKENNIVLLRTIGVIFSDEEKRITEYIN